jgi:hypothetical protein
MEDHYDWYIDVFIIGCFRGRIPFSSNFSKEFLTEAEGISSPCGITLICPSADYRSHSFQFPLVYVHGIPGCPRYLCRNYSDEEKARKTLPVIQSNRQICGKYPFDPARLFTGSFISTISPFFD